MTEADAAAHATVSSTIRGRALARIARMRALFVETLRRKGVAQDFGFIARQKGMFSFAGISPQQVDRLKDEFGIYAVRSGRINVAGMSESTMDRLCSAVAAVL